MTSKASLLLEYCTSYCSFKGQISKSRIVKWGLENFYISADRMVRTFVEKGLMKRLDKVEMIQSGLTGKMAWYRIKT